MSTAPIPFPGNGPGQATQIEQSRAVAQVQAAAVMARQFPRNVQAAVKAIEETCKVQAVASSAFYSYKRGGSSVSGLTVHIAREMARIWGNIDYGVSELSRDVAAGQSEMLAYAWDLETNTRSAQTFIVLHVRDSRGGQTPLTDLRDVYENNANNGARRVREAIFAVIPRWVVDTAERTLRQTLENGGGQSIEQRVAEALRYYDDLGVSQRRIEDRVKRPVAEWNGRIVGQLQTIYQSLVRGETTVEAEFPLRVTAEEITALHRQPAAQPDVSEAPHNDTPPAADWPEVAQPGTQQQ